MRDQKVGNLGELERWELPGRIVGRALCAKEPCPFSVASVKDPSQIIHVK